MHTRTCTHLLTALRQAAYLRANASRFEPFVPVEEGSDDAAGGLEAYCQKVEGSAMWGGHLELMALSGALQVIVTNAECQP